MTAAPALTVEIRPATFSSIEAGTAPGARCSEVVLPSDDYLLAGDVVVEKTADAAGLVSWFYPANAREHGPSTAVVSCALAEQTTEARARSGIP